MRKEITNVIFPEVVVGDLSLLKSQRPQQTPERCVPPDFRGKERGGFTTSLVTPILRTAKAGYSEAKRGFTLVELLVVVLIIGILAAVAVPQYNKAVEKSRVANAKIVLSSVAKAVDEYLLENGLPSSGAVELLASSTSEDGKTNMLSVDMEQGLDCASSKGICIGKDWGYDAYCHTTSCEVRAKRCIQADCSDMNKHYHVRWDYELNAGTGRWKKVCVWKDTLGKEMCTAISK